MPLDLWQHEPTGVWAYDTHREVQRRIALYHECEHDLEFRAEVWDRCCESFRFWLENFGWTHDPTKPLAKIPMRADWEFQVEFAEWCLGLSEGSTQPVDLSALREADETLAAIGDATAATLAASNSSATEVVRRSGMLVKSREMGASVIACDVAAWEFLTRPGSTNIFVSMKARKVDDNSLIFNNSLFAKIRNIVRWCPRWMRPSTWRDSTRARFDDNWLSLYNPDNGASIIGEASDPDKLRGARANRVWVDEANSIPWLDELLTAAKAVGPYMLLSSVKGTSTHFARLWHGRGGVEIQPYGEHVGRRGLVGFRWHYSQRPDRDPRTAEGRAWRDAQRAEYTPEGWAQEFEINFAASQTGRIWPMFGEAHLLDSREWRDIVLPRISALRLIEGWDFGYSKTLTACVWAYYDPDSDCVYVYDYRQWEDKTYQQVAEDYAAAGYRCKRNPTGIAPDRRVGDTHSGGKGARIEGGKRADPIASWIHNLRRHEDIRVNGRTLQVEEAITRVATALTNGRLFFGPKCAESRDRLPSLVECVSQYRREGKSEGAVDHVGVTPKPHKDVHSHAADALQHIAWNVWRFSGAE